MPLDQAFDHLYIPRTTCPRTPPKKPPNPSHDDLVFEIENPPPSAAIAKLEEVSATIASDHPGLPHLVPKLPLSPPQLPDPFLLQTEPQEPRHRRRSSAGSRAREAAAAAFWSTGSRRRGRLRHSCDHCRRLDIFAGAGAHRSAAVDHARAAGRRRPSPW